MLAIPIGLGWSVVSLAVPWYIAHSGPPRITQTTLGTGLGLLAIIMTPDVSVWPEERLRRSLVIIGYVVAPVCTQSVHNRSQSVHNRAQSCTVCA